LVAAIRAALSTELLDELSSLDHDLPHHAQFAERSAAWARATAAHIPSTVNPGASTQAFPWLNPRVEYVLRPQQLDADAHASKGAKLPERSKGQQQGDSTFAAEELARGVSGQSGGYRVFTTAHDRVVNAV